MLHPLKILLACLDLQLEWPLVYKASQIIGSLAAKKLLLIAKLGTTDYFDRSHISSGLQEISRSSQSDLEGKVEMVRKNGEKREKYIKNKKY